ncbi:MAG: glycosyltransferase family 2 protein [Burkholderiales bacterium]|nr:glycosyltransferase family 2 protein [Burkholderiales bacterium]
MKLSLVIPCFNEEKSLPALIARCEEVFGDADAEVLLVDNGSTDGSPALLAGRLAAGRRIRSVRVERNQGYGFGILSGLREARGEILAYTHADLQTDPADALVGLALFRASADPERLFVKGRRYGRPAADVFFTVGMSVFESALLGQGLWDINAQPTMFPASFFRSWLDAPHDFSLDLYAYYHARRRGVDVRRFPVRFGPRAHGQSHWNVNWAAKWRFIQRTIRFSLALRKAVKA